MLVFIFLWFLVTTKICNTSFIFTYQTHVYLLFIHAFNGRASLLDNKFSSSEGAGKITMTEGTIPTSGALSEQWFVFTKAGAAKSKLNFSFTIDGVAFTTATSKDNVAFEPGKKYVFNLTLSKDYHVDVESVDVQEWTEENEDVTVTDK